MVKPANDSINVVANGEVSITKSHSPAGPFNPGGSTTFTLTIAITGDAPVTGIVISDDYDEANLSVSAISDTGFVAFGVISWPAFTMNPGDVPVTRTYLATLNGAGSFPEGTTNVANTASLTSPEDSTVADNTANDSIAVTANGEVSITKGHSPAGPFGPGGTTTFTLTIAITGDAPVTGIAVSDDYDEANLSVSAISDTGTDALGAISWPAFTMNPGDAPVTRTYLAPLNGAGTFTEGTTNVANTASLTSPEDSTVADNTANDSINVVADGEVSITKSHNPAGPFGPGGTTTFTLTIAITGDAPVTGIAVSDDYDEANLSVSAISDTGTDALGVISWPTFTMNPGDAPVTRTYLATLNGAGTFPEGTTNVANTASLTSPEDSTANDSINVVANGEVSITKSHSPAGPFSPGGTTTFTLTIAITGDAPVTGIAVSDDYDETNLSVSAISDTGTDALGPISWPAFTMNPGDAPVTRTYLATLNGAGSFVEGTTNVANTASLTSPEDSTAGDNTANDSINVVANGEVSITKSHSPAGPFSPGGSTTFTLTIAITGDAPVTGIVVSDDYDEANLSVSAISNTGGDALGAISCSAFTMNPGDAPVTRTYLATLNGAGTFPEGTTNVANTASLTSPEDSTAGDNTANDSINVVANGEVSITKSHSPAGPFSPGGTTTFTLTIAITGDAPVTGIAVSDDYDETNLSVSAISDTGSDALGAISWPAFTMNPGDAPVTRTYLATLNGAGTFPEGTTNVANTSSLTSPEDSTVADNTSSDSIDVVAVVNLGLTKGVASAVPVTANIANSGAVSHGGVSDDTDSATACGIVVATDITFTLSVTNSGDADAGPVVIVDTLPSTVTIIATTNNSVNGLNQATIGVLGQAVTWSFSNIAAGETVTVTVTVRTL